MTIASPCVVSFTAHGLTLNDSIQFTTTGALPTGLNVSTNYFVISTGLTADAFQISATLGWAAVNTSGSQSGTHTLYKTTPVAIGNQDPSITGGGTLGTPWSGNKFMTQAGVQSGSETYGTDAGGDDTYVVALSPVLTAYTVGQPLRFKPTTSNTGACTIDFWPGVKNIKTIDGNDPQTGVIRANWVYTVVYDGTSFVLQNEDFATTNNKGIVEMATDAEVLTATDETRYINPKQAKDSVKWKSFVTSGTLLVNDANQSNITIAHGLWRVPHTVQLQSGSSFTGVASYDGTTITQKCYNSFDQNIQNALLWYEADTGADIWYWYLSALDATNVTLSYSWSGSYSPINYVYILSVIA